MGSNVIRKLLLEENLKLRGRKDSKVSRACALTYCTLKSFSAENAFITCLTFSIFLSRGAMQLEVVALLFSDVLLLTKIQKKGERLKVVRPPLTLDRTHCIALKDGCKYLAHCECRRLCRYLINPITLPPVFLSGSFVLVEVGELQSAMSVYIISASTPERCATWISNIQQAKVKNNTSVRRLVQKYVQKCLVAVVDRFMI